MDITSKEIQLIKITDKGNNEATIYKDDLISAIIAYGEDACDKINIEIANTGEYKKLITDSFLKKEYAKGRNDLALLGLILSYFDDSEVVVIVDKSTVLRTSEAIEYFESYFFVKIDLITEEEYAQLNTISIERDIDDFDFAVKNEEPVRTRGEHVIRKVNPNKKKQIDYQKLKFVLGAVAALAIFAIYFISR